MLKFKAALLIFCLVVAPVLTFAQEDEIENDLDDVEAIKPGDFNPDGSSRRQDQKPAATPAAQTQTKPGPPAELRRHNEDDAAPEYKPSASQGQPMFDWSKHQGETEVKHPLVGKGLIRIGKDGTYYYKVNEPTPHRAMSLQVGVFNPTNLRNPDEPADSQGVTFHENYDQTSNPAFMLTKEWELWVGALGKLNLQVGTGAYIAQGHGHFVGGVNAAKTPMEVFTFIDMPNNIGAVYRMQFSHRPLFVPFVAGGGTVFTFAEMRDDNKGPKFGGSLAAYASAGLGLNLSYFDYLSRIQLQHEYGITAVYLTGEYRRIQAITTRFDMTSDFFNGGFLMEY